MTASHFFALRFGWTTKRSLAFTVQTLVAQGVRRGCDPVTNAVTPPVHMSDHVFTRSRQCLSRPATSMAEATTFQCSQAENLIAALEGADEALLFSSGMAAATGVLLCAGQTDTYHRLANYVLGLSGPG